MVEDYRNTEYCSPLGDVLKKKEKVVDAVKKDHPYAVDIHEYVKKNGTAYKRAFLEAYNGKCSYCGVTLSIIPQSSFEIDHFIPESDSRFKSKKDAGYIENLVLACHKCNHSKSGLIIPDLDHQYLNPDHTEITNTFFRDEYYYIRVSESKKDNKSVIEFYNKLDLGADLRRLDYLLLSMKGLRGKISGGLSGQALFDHVIDVLQRKRNLHG